MKPSAIVDANVIFAALLRRCSRDRQIIFTSSTHQFVAPKFLFVELFKHKERIIFATQFPEDELLDTLHAIMGRVQFIEEGLISVGDWIEARRLCREVDLKDTAFVALTIHLRGELWTRDAALEHGLRARGFLRFFSPPLE